MYLNSQVNKTAVTEFNWVCHSSWIGSFSVTIYMAGIMAAGFVFGIASDLMGRKVCVLVAFVIEIAAGLLSALAPNEICFLVARGLLGFGCYGRNITGFLIAIETVGTKYRAIMGVAVQLGWATGTILLPPIAYYTQNYRTLILITTLPEIAWFIWMIFLIPESPRWLLNKRRYEEAKVIIINAARMNGKPLSEIEEKFEFLKINLRHEDESVPGNDSVFSDLWKSKKLIQYTLVFYFVWFTNAFVYYGISLNVSDLGGNLYWSSFWSGLVEFPAYLFCMAIFKYVGRRPLLVWTMIGAGISCLGIVPLFTVSGWKIQVLLDILAFAGKFCVTCSFALIYVYSAEVYPTVLRQIGVGSCSVVARIGSFISPFMKELVSAKFFPVFVFSLAKFNVYFVYLQTQYSSFGTTMAVYGVLSVLSGVAAITLPETKDKDIPDRVKDIEELTLEQA